ncbi:MULTISPECIES: SNF2-related protein [Bifidobacterium]|nr:MULTISPECIES: SNF2-related protein [Bifidobacterium]
MSDYIQFVDNRKQSLGDILRQIAASGKYQDLSIVTGYWDMAGTTKLIDLIKDYRSVRILIGAEPYSNRRLNLTNIYKDFPDADIAADLKNLENLPEDQIALYRRTAHILAMMIREHRLEVRICRRPFIHAKEYVFGSYDTSGAIGIIGSSNFTGRGLSDIATGGNAELNYLEDNEPIVLYQPHNEQQQYGHLSWFDAMWNLPEVQPWTGDFQEILSNSPVGNRTYGPYDVYIKALTCLFPDELAPSLDDEHSNDDVLYTYQKRNAGLLISKLHKNGTAILADSVGLGKTVTAGAVIRHYHDNGKRNIVILPPAKLKGQWRRDLKEFFNLNDNDYSLISQQDIPAIQQITELYKRSYPADLIVIDEAHNLRNERSERFKTVLNLVSSNPDAKVLLLTATPINNGFKDLVSQLELGLGGRLQSGIMVTYQNPTDSTPTRTQDFFDFLKELDTRRKTAERKGAHFDWEDYRQPLSQGISHFVVRSTRQGVQEEAALQGSGDEVGFPGNVFHTIDYAFPQTADEQVRAALSKHADMFEGLNPFAVDEDALADKTQRILHPIDIVNRDPDKYIGEKTSENSLVRDVVSLVSLMGFPAYRSVLYRREYRTMSVERLGLADVSEDVLTELRSAMTIHNILQTIWMKRLESSLSAFVESVKRYRKRLKRFDSWLDRGYVVETTSLSILDDDDEEQSTIPFWDDPERDTDNDLDALGVAYDKADGGAFDIAGLRKDIQRDYVIADVLIEGLTACITGDMDAKIDAFASQFTQTLHDGRFGGKVLIFSAYADTIDYLRRRLPEILEYSIPDFRRKSAFLTAQASDLEGVVGRFSPHSKKHVLDKDERELDYLFTTDVLSEGQNLQDAAILINYDLHWNPVRMVQRNGRINRLGSKFKQVLIGNMAPTDDLEYYLGLLSRLQGKIDTIKNSIGTDQGILTSSDENPIEYIQDLYSGDDEKIQNVMDSVDSDNDLLSWRDRHVYALREFLGRASENEKSRVVSMPSGKWNFLPASAGMPHTVLTLCEQKNGVGNGRNYRFVRVDTTGKQPTAALTNEQALDLLQTTPDDNARRVDNVDIDRKSIESQVLVMAGARKQGKPVGRFRPKSADALYLGLLQKQLGSKSLLADLGKVQGLVQARQQYDKLMKRLKNEAKHVAKPDDLIISDRLLKDWRVLLDSDIQEKTSSQGRWRCVFSSMSATF